MEGSMRRIIGIAAMTAALAVPASAAASPSEPLCSSGTHGATWGTPGKMFQYGREATGLNPAAVAGVHGATVGQFVQIACG